MKVAVINEVSAKDKNKHIIAALQKNNCQVISVGMNEEPSQTLTYIHTGLMAGILLNLGTVDLVVGGCGTGQGFLVSAMQYPLVFGGLIETPLDAWLFGQINGGNCISLALNKGYGWAGDVNLVHIFEKLFDNEFGSGYPQERKESQKESRQLLKNISLASHKSFIDILSGIEQSLLDVIFAHKPFVDAIYLDCKNTDLQRYIIDNYLGAK